MITKNGEVQDYLPMEAYLGKSYLVAPDPVFTFTFREIPDDIDDDYEDPEYGDWNDD